jgi:hypothetical protein
VKGAEAATTAYHRRALAYGKNWTNLYIATTSPTAAEVLAYFRQALLLGYYPGFNGSYWTNSSLYERDRANFRIYMPLIKKAVLAGWKPIPYATPSDPAIYVERFDDEVGATFYLTAQNSSTSAKTFQMTVDAAALGATSGTITLKELVGNTTLSASRSGSNIFFSDTLAAGETAAYQMTVGSGGTSSAPTPTPPPSTTPPPSATPAPSGTNLVINGGFETGSGSPTGWTLGVGLTSGNWFWDASTFHTGSRSVKLAVAGTTNQISENLTSASFALAKSTTHTLTAWTKSSSIGGIYEPLVWLVETDSAGNPLRDASGDIVRHSVSADAGTTGWVQKTTAFETDSRCVRAYVYALIYKGHGTVWLDDISVK